MFTSWKTTITGVGMILFGVVGLVLGKVTWDVAGPSIVGGLGLIFAKDSDVTGGTRTRPAPYGDGPGD